MIEDEEEGESLDPVISKYRDVAQIDLETFDGPLAPDDAKVFCIFLRGPSAYLSVSTRSGHCELCRTGELWRRESYVPKTGPPIDVELLIHVPSGQFLGLGPNRVLAAFPRPTDGCFWRIEKWQGNLDLCVLKSMSLGSEGEYFACFDQKWQLSLSRRIVDGNGMPLVALFYRTDYVPSAPSSARSRSGGTRRGSEN